jgi:hypothetical protein
LISCPSAHDAAPTISPAEAEQLAQRIRALFSAHARFFTTGETGDGSGPEPAEASEASSLFVIDGDRAGLFWVERDD